MPKRRLRDRTCLALVVALGLAPAAPAAADEIVLGLVGAPDRFALVTDGGRTGASRFARLTAVSLEGRAGPARVVIELSLPPGADPAKRVLDGRVIYRPDGFRDFWISHGPLPTDALTVEALDLTPGAARIAGRFSLPLCPVTSVLAAPDPTRCAPAEGRFDAPLILD